MTNIKVILITLASIILISIITFSVFGWSEGELMINKVNTYYTVYIEAEYSEDNSYYDFTNGEYVSDTDYWDERVSDIWTIVSENNIIINTNVPKVYIKGFKCSDPPITYPHDKGISFDRYTYKRDFKLTVTTDFGERKIYDYKQYKIALKAKNDGLFVKVKTHWGEPVDFLNVIIK